MKSNVWGTRFLRVTSPVGLVITNSHTRTVPRASRSQHSLSVTNCQSRSWQKSYRWLSARATDGFVVEDTQMYREEKDGGRGLVWGHTSSFVSCTCYSRLQTVKVLAFDQTEDQDWPPDLHQLLRVHKASSDVNLLLEGQFSPSIVANYSK